MKIELLIFSIVAVAVLSITTYMLNGKSCIFKPFNELVKCLEVSKVDKVSYSNEEKLSIFPHSATLEGNVKNIEEESNKVLTNKKNIYILRKFGVDNVKAKHECPLLYSLIKNHPEMNTVNISKIKEGECISSNKGITQATVKYILGVNVPNDEKYQSNVILKNKVLALRTRGSVMFNDCHNYGLDNTSETDKILLSIDVKQKFKNDYLNKINDIQLSCIKMLQTN